MTRSPLPLWCGGADAAPLPRSVLQGNAGADELCCWSEQRCALKRMNWR